MNNVWPELSCYHWPDPDVNQMERLEVIGGCIGSDQTEQLNVDRAYSCRLVWPRTIWIAMATSTVHACIWITFCMELIFVVVAPPARTLDYTYVYIRTTIHMRCRPTVKAYIAIYHMSYLQGHCMKNSVENQPACPILLLWASLRRPTEL